MRLSNMLLKTRVFDLLENSGYKNVSELAKAMEISVSQVYRVRQGKRSINQKFLIGAIRAFPEYKIGELFYFASSDLPAIVRDAKIAAEQRVVRIKALNSSR